MAKFFLLCFLSFVGSLQLVTAETAAVVVLQDVEKTITLGQQLATFRSEEVDLNIQKISSPAYRDHFSLNTVDATNYGYHDGDFWLKFEVKSFSDADWHLVLDYMVFGAAELFVLPQPLDKSAATRNGVEPHFLPVEQYRTPAWKLLLPQGQQFTVYLRIRSFNEPMVIPLKLMSGKHFLLHSQYRYIFFTMVVTSMAVLLVYNLFLAFSLRDKSYLALVLFLFLFGVFVYRSTNIFPSIWDLLIGNGNKYYASLSFLTHAVGFYYWHILHRNTDRWLEIFTKSMALISLVLTVVCFFQHQVASSFLLMFIPALLFLPALMVRAIVLGHHSTRGSFISMTCLMFSIGIYAPFYTGYFPTYPLSTFYVGHIGIVLAMLLFSLSHADRTRQLRAQAERFEANNKATQNFLTTMSHELRTPMHTILGANELLRNTQLNQVQKSYLNSAEVASQQMMNLVDDVLDTARLHSPQPVINNKKAFNLYQLLENIEKILSIQAERKGLDFAVNFEGISYGRVIGHEKSLNQVLTNLIGNAIKYTRNGKIILTVKKSVTQYIENEFYFGVQDTGPGIAIEHQELLFQPFYQIDNDYSRYKDGAGLGLSISHKLVHQMGGELKLDSVLGQGSCFYFSLVLPLCNEQVNLDESKQKKQPVVKSGNVVEDRQFDALQSDESIPSQVHLSGKPLSDLKILLVDDGELNLMLGEQLLTLHGAYVVLAQSGKEALQKLKYQLFDLVLMDISMPDMDGYQTTRLLREDKKLSELPVIALTAHALAGERDRCIAAGMDDYLSKPFHTEQLIKLIKQHCPKI